MYLAGSKTSLTLASTFTAMARHPKYNVPEVSWLYLSQGPTVQITAVTLVPPRQSFNSRVSFAFRYGMWYSLWGPLRAHA